MASFLLPEASPLNNDFLYRVAIDLRRKFGDDLSDIAVVFPNKRAAEIAVRTVTNWLSAHSGAIERVIFNVFKDEDKAYYEAELQ